MDVIALIERDLSICAIISKLAHRDRKLQELSYFESHVMELVAVVDQDEQADILCIGVAFLMDAVAEETVNLMEMAQILSSQDLLYSLNFMIKLDEEDTVAHTMRISEDARARIVKTHDLNLRMKKLDREKNEELFQDLFRQKSILESIHVQNFPERIGEDQSLN